ncbi:putative nuclease HARBI1 [Procambarus clarkii]|uniref:putative nuclease HARBI1 n=1 Tax=Procambarus clarkii TaxID=6728 RepID=UPI0037438783
MLLLIALRNELALRRERVFKDRLNPLDVSDKKLLRYYRFPRHMILRLCEDLKDDIKRITRRGQAIPAHTSLLVALRFYASGSFQSVIGDSTGLSQSSVSRIITGVTEALYRKGLAEIKMPTEMNEIIQTKLKFNNISRFPNVIGAIDCTHVPIKAPKVEENIYVNRKQYHSLNIQVVSNPDNVIMDFCARYPGSTHDAFIWANSRLHDRFEAGEFGISYLLGDSGYPLQHNLLTPFTNHENPPEELYNRSHARTRVVIEKTFGVLKSRFRCLHRSGGSLQYEPDKCAKISVACMLLHNYCIEQRIPLEEIIDDDFIMNENVEGGAHENGHTQRREVVRNFFS